MDRRDEETVVSGLCLTLTSVGGFSEYAVTLVLTDLPGAVLTQQLNWHRLLDSGSKVVLWHDNECSSGYSELKNTQNEMHTTTVESRVWV